MPEAEFMEYLIMSAVKDHLKKNKLRIATATYEELDEKVKRLLDDACSRTKRNKRQTVMPQDL